jgi:hypothetical protein
MARWNAFLALGACNEDPAAMVAKPAKSAS